MPAYDVSQFNPPAPVAAITLRNSQTGGIVADVPMLLDSGADVTLIPQSAARSLGLEPIADSRYELVGFDGTTSFASVVRLELIEQCVAGV
ncbi:MAG: aspartyl protease family protein [Kouleothrix sp.]|nr:aspartyl protease family protein [Kouleothrix sp.]